MKQADEVPPKEIFVSEYRVGNIEQILKQFWWCSLYDAWEWFDFEEAFEVVEEILRKKLGEHNYLPEEYQWDYYRDLLDYDFWMFKDLIDNTFDKRMTRNQRRYVYEELNKEFKKQQQMEIDEIFEDCDEEPYDLDVYGIHPDNVASRKSVETIVESLRLGQEFIDIIMDVELFSANEYDRILDKWKKIPPYGRLPRKQYRKIALFDEIIDLYHVTGHVFEQCVPDIENLRRDFNYRIMRNS